MNNHELLSAQQILMVDPIGFTYNPQTATTNAFQSVPSSVEMEFLEKKAREEFHDFANLLIKEGIQVHVIAGQHGLPDAVFPNNLFSTDPNGTWIDYPMMAPNRQAERLLDPKNFLMNKGFQIEKTIDLTHWEQQHLYLEGTGSLILHTATQQAWIAESARANRAVVQDWALQTGFSFHMFSTKDRKGNPVYHTNVLMSIGTKWHLICPDLIPEFQKWEHTLESLSSHRIEISEDQVHQFAGNVIELKNNANTPFIVISKTGWTSLTAQQKRAMEQFAQPLIVNIETIEKVGGGSARCMIAEIFLSQK